MDIINTAYKRLFSSKFVKQFLNRYFYSRSSVHYRMLEDQIRMNAYKKAIERYVKPDDTVLDIGCGIGILSFLAAKHGCKKIYAVDNSPIINEAIKIAKNNDLENKIEFHRKDLFSLKLKNRVDVLLHEAIGAFIFDENLIEIIKYSKKNFLKKEGKILPDKIGIFLAPTSYETKLQKEITFWSKKQHDLNLKNMLELSLKNNKYNLNKPTMIEIPNKNDFLAKEKKIHSLDLNSNLKIPKELIINFPINKSRIITGFCGFFKVYFDEEIYLSTEPQIKNTHWMQFFLPIYNETILKEGKNLNLKLNLDENINQWKWSIKIL